MGASSWIFSVVGPGLSSSVGVNVDGSACCGFGSASTTFPFFSEFEMPVYSSSSLESFIRIAHALAGDNPVFDTEDRRQKESQDTSLIKHLFYFASWLSIAIELQKFCVPHTRIWRGARRSSWWHDTRGSSSTTTIRSLVVKTNPANIAR
jgi:hypothetical protein